MKVLYQNLLIKRKQILFYAYWTAQHILCITSYHMKCIKFNASHSMYILLVIYIPLYSPCSMHFIVCILLSASFYNHPLSPWISLSASYSMHNTYIVHVILLIIFYAFQSMHIIWCIWLNVRGGTYQTFCVNSFVFKLN